MQGPCIDTSKFGFDFYSDYLAPHKFDLESGGHVLDEDGICWCMPQPIQLTNGSIAWAHTDERLERYPWVRR